MNLDEAERAAVVLLRDLGRRLRAEKSRKFFLKKRGDLVTRADSRAERMLRENLPAAAFWGEETGRSLLADWCWIVDPLDGTTNFAHRYPHSAVSLALAFRDEVRLGIVYDLYRRELFTARRGAGARLNGRPIGVSSVDHLQDALLSTGFGPDSHLNEYERFRALNGGCHGVRRSGCCSLDLCWVAAGRLEGYYEWDLQPWDIAAGALIVTEAGGRFTRLDGTPARLVTGDFLASNGLLHEELCFA